MSDTVFPYKVVLRGQNDRLYAGRRVVVSNLDETARRQIIANELRHGNLVCFLQPITVDELCESWSDWYAINRVW